MVWIVNIIIIIFRWFPLYNVDECLFSIDKHVIILYPHRHITLSVTAQLISHLVRRSYLVLTIKTWEIVWMCLRLKMQNTKHCVANCQQIPTRWSRKPRVHHDIICILNSKRYDCKTYVYLFFNYLFLRLSSRFGTDDSP